MTTRTMPGFTAAASLYGTSGHYRTSNSPPNLRARQTGTVLLSAIDVPGEVIEIEDDAPWSPPSWGGHTGPGTSGPPVEPGGGDGGGSNDSGIPSTSPPDPDPMRGCSPSQVTSKAAKACTMKVAHDLMNSVKNPHYLQCVGNQKGDVAHPKMQCCRMVRDKPACKDLN